MLTQAPRGTRDVLPADSYRWQFIENKMRSAAALAGYREVRTPVFEHTELFLRGVGDTTDIVQKEMYTFEDKGKRSITLKPEGTAGAVRCFLEHNLYAEPLPCKMYYLNAPIFRYENPQSGRLREHHQFGLECFGAKEATVDAELILLAFHLLQDLGVGNLSVEINSIGCPKCRPVYHERLKEYLSDRMDKLCTTCRERFDRNPLRVLDCKEKNCQELTKDAPSMLDLLCDECREHFDQLKACLDQTGIPYRVNPRIVRGLDYYTKTVFELVTKTEDGNLTVCGGGRYDNLVDQIGEQSIPAVGFGMGLERVLMLLNSEGIEIPKPAWYEVFVTYMGANRQAAFALVQQLRQAGIRADLDHCGRSLKAQFKFANKTGAPITAVIGDEEAANGTVKLKRMADGEEKTVAMGNVCEAVSKLGGFPIAP
jgi:histidyl-tRNA synthetase